MKEEDNTNHQLLYAADETPPHGLSLFLGFQAIALIISGIALTPVVVLRIAGADAVQNSWVIFAAFIISGLTTCLQARPIGRWGSGYPLFMGTSGAFIAVGAAAVESGGLALLATLAATSALVQLALAARLSWFRNVITPSVGGVIVMLIVVTVFPVCTGLLTKVPAGSEGMPAALTAGVTFVAIVGIAIFGSKRWRLWGPLIGVVAGTLTAIPFGLFDTSGIKAAAWIGFPQVGWPGMDLSFDSRFWALFPAFAIVTVVGAIETFGDAVSMQRCGHRGSRPIDFRSVQGALRADGVGNLLSGLFGTLPNTTYSTSVSLVEFTGVAARRVALYGGGILLILAFFPKVSALLQAIPNPVVGAYLIILLAILFSAGGIRLVANGGLSAENGLIVGISFWMGTAFQSKAIFPALMPEWMHTLMDNGMTAGGLTALVLSWLFSLRRGRSNVLKIGKGSGVVGSVHEFLEERALAQGWDEDATRRLQLVGEESVMFLLDGNNETDKALSLSLRFEESKAILEFAYGATAANLEAAIGELAEKSAGTGQNAALRILNSLAASVEHHHFNDGDFLAVSVESRGI
ncbi:uracil-xanthine permease family protein [Rubellicoccus peritrichatus]|uniref:Solute carrier family 23 protein n=1 Tax=Rubellicoccus peritrichatus TaxID=3080537 RepID=A0AAQ3LAI9_9BACT|nr:solute carrier family 23 protein [Puniceicoccus sp. CR14]WOO42126.1 solute carrier family 23 protein [Puniceicoccus sp. CR14]